MLFCALDVGAGEIDLIDDRNNRVVVAHGQVDVGDGLRLHPLRRVDEQQRAFTGREAARHFVREVDVTGRIDQMQ